MPFFGVHESISGGFENAVYSASATGFQCVQIFSKNSNRWQARPIEAEAAQKFRDSLAQRGLVLPLIHDSYLINLASPDEAQYEKSVAAFADELTRADVLGVPAVVMHPGAAKDDPVPDALRRVAGAFDRIFDELPTTNKTLVYIETTAGQGTYLGAKFEEIAEIIAASAHPERLGVCFDTCHSFAAGYDITTPEGREETFSRFDDVIGLDRLRAFHLNDSVKGLGSRVDRHAHIGFGAIGKDAFRAIINDPRFAELPMYLETPKGEMEDGRDWDAVNLKTLQEMLE
ncbi:MAG: deoxyribonuclease IV [Thermoguttaceae bacterium]|nr:deoxyribonuclease IV [Thermoguttaceae bacterium]